MRFCCWFFLLLGWAPLAQAQEKNAEGFVLVRQDGTTSMYERWITFPESNPPQEAREVKGEFFISSTISRIVALMKDEANIRTWQTHVSEFKVYPQRDTTVWHEYSYHDIPWPVSDQDHFLEYNAQEVSTGKEWFITFRSRIDAARAPRRDGVTRMTLSGSWRLEQLEPNRVKVTYRILSMPIGIPRLFTDPVIRTNLMSTIKALIKLAEQP